MTKCRICGHENAAEAKFCLNCGTPIDQGKAKISQAVDNISEEKTVLLDPKMMDARMKSEQPPAHHPPAPAPPPPPSYQPLPPPPPAYQPLPPQQAPPVVKAPPAAPQPPAAAPRPVTPVSTGWPAPPPPPAAPPRPPAQAQFPTTGWAPGAASPQQPQFPGQSGYAPQQPQAPLQQPYPPPPPQTGGFPPPPAGYPQQPGGYPQQPGGYPPGPGFPPPPSPPGYQPPVGFGMEPEKPLLEPAGFGVRFLAYLIDMIIVNLPSCFIGFILGLSLAASGMSSDKIQQIANNPLINLLTLAIGAAYFTLFIGSRGQTLGKMVMGLKVIRTDGTDVGYALALGRWGGYLLSSFICMIGFLLPLFRSDNLALHDLICKTEVVKIR